ncbi:MAG TPA: serine/threonine-protein kinase [Sandaracinaceae bacterium LLY-WYZ-13_1]|nr:serine/threonine-protein kinase [Sandaracinaceae bacterium LLY-WYZ-13_1]
MSDDVADAGRDTGGEDRFRAGVRVGSYELERRLGQGGMGAVYAARHVGLDKPVAIKTLHPSLSASGEQVTRFVREGRAASRIRHPHVVDVTDVGTHDGIPYLVMEYLEGEDLESRLRRCERLAPAEIARIMLPVLDALATAHEAGVVHRDLKPSNVFLARGPHGREIPKVLDFGIAKLLEADEIDRVTITRAASFLGTPYYASPEQAKSGKNADALSDQYSLGAMIYELATGRPPVRGASPWEVLMAIVAGQVDRIRDVAPDVHDGLATIVERAMAHERADRYPSVRELGRALLALAGPEDRWTWARAFGEQPSSTPPGAPASTPTDDAPAVAPPSSDPPAEPARPAPNVPAASASASTSSVAASNVAAGTPAALPAGAPADAPAFSPPQAPSAADAPPRPPKRRAPLVALLAALVVVIGGGAAAGWWLAGAGDDEAPGDAAAATERVRVRAEPATATFELDGAPIGTGPVEIPRDGRSHRLRVSAPGHRAEELRIDATRPPPSLVALAPLEPPPAPATPPGASASHAAPEHPEDGAGEGTAGDEAPVEGDVAARDDAARDDSTRGGSARGRSARTGSRPSRPPTARPLAPAPQPRPLGPERPGDRGNLMRPQGW